ncbi:MAG: hypothetical protein ACO3YN_14895 [Rubrivivax sp.]
MGVRDAGYYAIDVRYGATGEPIRTFVCHCGFCQRVTGSTSDALVRPELGDHPLPPPDRWAQMAVVLPAAADCFAGAQASVGGKPQIPTRC